MTCNRENRGAQNTGTTADRSRKFRSRSGFPRLPPNSVFATMANAVGGARPLPAFSASRRGSIYPHAHREPADPQAPHRAQGEDEDAGAPRSPAKAGRVHARLHDDPEEAELGPPESRPCP